MAHEGGELRVGGLKIWARFTLFMTIALTIVMSGAGFFLYRTSSQVTESVQTRALLSSIELTARSANIDVQTAELLARRDLLTSLERMIIDEGIDDVDEVKADLRSRRLETQSEVQELAPYWQQVDQNVRNYPGVHVQSTAIFYGPDKRKGTLFRYKDPEKDQEAPFHLLLPDAVGEASSGLLGLIVGTTILVILVGAGVSVWVANQVSGPLEQIVHDIRQISTGDLNHHTRAKGGGEIALLARSIDRMTSNLKGAQETQLELQIREREVEVAGEVREALLPQKTPTLEGYDLGAAHLSSSELGGDFHDFISLGDEKGRVGLLVCDVSGNGLPGALVGATARSYLRAELMNGGDVSESFQLINRQIAQDVRRGMYVTALYVLVDPAAGIATVACAGHKIPLVRYTAEDKKVRLIQPEGIALGFDKGPVFDRSLKVQQVPLDPGDRLVVVNTGAVSIANPDGAELGEKPLYKQVMVHGGLSSEEFLAKLSGGLKNYAGGTALPRDVSLVTIARG